MDVMCLMLDRERPSATSGSGADLCGEGAVSGDARANATASCLSFVPGNYHQQHNHLALLTTELLAAELLRLSTSHLGRYSQ